MTKYKPEEGQLLLEWLNTLTGEAIDTNGDMVNFQKQLVDGVVLCK